MKPLVSAIVTTKNNGKIIGRCLFSIQQQDYHPLEIIVVDNFSTDRTVDIARGFTPLVFSAGPERSAQRNLGARHARGRYVFFLDSDMELQPNVVSDCAQKIESNKALVVPEIFFGKGFWTRCKILDKSCSKGTDDGVAARFYPRKDFFAVEGYDEQLTGPEDIDLHKRILERGSIGTSVVPIIHHDNKLTLRGIVRKRYYYSLSLRRYLNKHPLRSRREFRFIRPAYILNWRMLVRDPVHAAGMLAMRFLEGLAVLTALWRTR